MVDNDKPKKTMLVVLGRLQDLSFFDQAVDLAGLYQAELSVLFIEDVDLFHLSGLPFVLEFDRLTSVSMRVDPERMSEKSDSHVRKFRKHLAEYEKNTKISVSFKIVRGRLLTEALSAAKHVDFLLFAKPRNIHSNQQKKSNLPKFFRELPVWVIFSNSEASVRAIELAIKIAQTRKTELNIILDVEAGQYVSELERKAKEIINSTQINRHFFVKYNHGYASLLQFIQQRGCGIALIPNDELKPDRTQLNAAMFAEEAGVPVIFVS